MVLELKSIYKKYNSEIFKDFSYIFKKNNIYFLRGKNGSGKTTLLKLIKGIYLIDDGQIIFDNNLSQKNDVAYINGNFRTFFHRLTIRQNLEYFFSLQSRSNNLNLINDLLGFFNISNLEHKTFSTLSQGQMQIVSLIRGFLSEPKIILLDEVFSSLDTTNKKKVFKYVTDIISHEETLVIFTSHEEKIYGKEIKELCLS